MKIISVLEKINHKPTRICTHAERNFLKILKGDCETAAGGFAKIHKNNIILEAELFSLDGSKRFYLKSSKNFKSSADLGREVGRILKKKSKNSYKK